VACEQPTPARRDWPAGGIEFHPATATGCAACGFVVEALHELYAPEDAQAHEHYDIATAQWARQRPSGGPRGRTLQPLTTGRWCSWLWERARRVWISMILTKEIHDQLVGPASDPARGEPRRGFQYGQCDRPSGVG